MTKNILAITQIIVSILLIISIVFLQKGEGGAGQIFGQEKRFYRNIRGMEKKVFFSTIVLGLIFIALGLLSLTS